MDAACWIRGIPTQNPQEKTYSRSSISILWPPDFFLVKKCASRLSRKSAVISEKKMGPNPKNQPLDLSCHWWQFGRSNPETDTREKQSHSPLFVGKIQWFSGAWTTHLKNMRKSNWIISLRIGVKIKKIIKTITYTPENERLEPKNYPIEKAHHLPNLHYCVPYYFSRVYTPEI